MSLPCSRLVTVTVATLAMSVSLAHARFEPLVQVSNATGDALVTEPGADTSEPVVQDKAYPYGSSFKTGDDSSVTLRFSDGNHCSLLPNTDARFTQNKKRGKTKTVEVVVGKVEVQLSADLADSGEQVIVRAPAVSITGIDCHFRVDAAADGDHRVVVIRSIRGITTVNGDYIVVRALPESGSMSVYSPVDMSYLRVVNIKGVFPVVVRDDSGGERPVETTPGSVVKVWRRPVPESTQVMVAVMLTNEKGAAISFKDLSGNNVGNTVTGVYQAGETLSGAPLSAPGADGHGVPTDPTDTPEGPKGTGDKEPQDKLEETPEPPPTGNPDPGERRNPTGPFPRDWQTDIPNILGTTTTQYNLGVTPVGQF
jgi:hypothetical protein